MTRRPRRHLGRAPGPRRRSRARSSTRTCRARTSSTRLRDDVHVTARDLLARARRARAPRRACATTSASACSTSRRGCAASGCVPLYNLMEDAATAEISRAQVWQWIRHGARARRRPPRHARAASRSVLRRGARGDRASEVGAERFARRAASTRAARALRRLLATRRAFEEFLTLPAYDELVRPNDEEAATEATTGATDGHDDADRRTRSHRDVAPTTRAVDGIARPYSRRGRRAPRAARSRSSTRSPSSARERLWELLHTRGLRRTRSARSPATRRCSRCAPASRRSTSPAGRSRPTRTLSGQMYPDQSLYPVDSRAARRAADQPGAAPRRPDRARRGQARASTGSRRSSPTPRPASAAPLNAFELMKAMIEAGAAGVHFEDQLASREEVRPHGRQGARPDAPVHPHADRGAPRGRRAGRADAPRRAHRRRQREAPHQRRRRARPRRSCTGERTPEGFFRIEERRRARPSPAASPTRRTRTCVWCETSTPDLDAGEAVRRGDPREVPRQAARVQLLAVVQLEEEPRRRDDRASSSASSARWATSSSSSRSPASTR